MHYLAEPKQHGLSYVQSITGEHTFILYINIDEVFSVSEPNLIQLYVILAPHK